MYAGPAVGRARTATGRAMLGAHGLPVLDLLRPGRCGPAAGSAASRDHRLGASSGFRTRRCRASALGPAATPSRRRQGAGPGKILVSRTIRDLVAGAPIRLETRGTHQLKGVPGSWEVFAVVS